MDVLKHNREAWNRQVRQGNPWTIPASAAQITRARKGDWEIVLTPKIPVPRNWFPPLDGCRVLCLASGGGQQGPILAAAGASVCVFDNSPEQLNRDREVSQRENLDIRCVQGDMADLSVFEDASFDFIVHPVSNIFAQDIRPVWREAFRVLRNGGEMISGIANPLIYLFDQELEKKSIYRVKYSLPYSDLTSRSAEELQKLMDEGEPVEFGHTLDDQIGGQLDAGFYMLGFYEDVSGYLDSLDEYCPSFFATRCRKP